MKQQEPLTQQHGSARLCVPIPCACACRRMHVLCLYIRQRRNDGETQKSYNRSISMLLFSSLLSRSIFLLMKANLLSGSVRSRPGPAICWSAVGPLSESDICRSHCITWKDKHCSRPSGGQKFHSVLIRGFIHFFKASRGVKAPLPHHPSHSLSPAEDS